MKEILSLFEEILLFDKESKIDNLISENGFARGDVGFDFSRFFFSGGNTIASGSNFAFDRTEFAFEIVGGIFREVFKMFEFVDLFLEGFDFVESRDMRGES